MSATSESLLLTSAHENEAKLSFANGTLSKKITFHHTTISLNSP